MVLVRAVVDPSAELTAFRAARHFPALDGLRAVAVLLVLTWHDLDPLWAPLRGYLGVTVFFVLSGFLITTLLLREEERDGSVSFRGFAVRRAFRILPLYYLVLAANVVLVYGAGLSSSADTFTGNLVHFLTFTNELGAPGTFGHSWSLGVEEKFYVVWPLLAFGLVAARRYRWLLVLVLLAAGAGSALAPSTAYFSVYTPILAGCAVALLAHDPRTGRVFVALARPWVGLALVVLAGASALLTVPQDAQPLVGVCVALALPTFVVGRSLLLRAVSRPVLRWVGRRSYAVYLVHPVVLSAVDTQVPVTGSAATAVLRLLLVAAGSLAVAEVLFRTVERPLQERGRRLARRRSAEPARSVSRDARPA